MANKKEILPDDIIKVLAENYPCMVLKELSQAFNCCDQIMMSYLMPLVESGKVLRINKGSDKKPIYFYYLKERR